MLVDINEMHPKYKCKGGFFISHSEPLRIKKNCSKNDFNLDRQGRTKYFL